jgi:hypothetical protein
MEAFIMTIAEQAREFYETTLKAKLEANQCDRYVAIEPVSESYYIADNFFDAALAAKRAHPDHKSFVLRIGHDAAFHLGGCTA